MRKKVITIAIVIILLFQSITISYGSDAYEGHEAENFQETDNTVGSDAYEGHKAENFQEIDNTVDGETSDSIYNEGSVYIEEVDRYFTQTESSGPSTATTLTNVLTFLPWIVSNLMTAAVTTGNDRNGMYSTTPDEPITVQSMVFDRIELLNANYFAENANTANYTIKQSVKNWYSGVRIIAIAASIVILIYMGIRMAISTVASSKAKYKKMLYDWLVSFGMIFVLHFIIVFLSNLSTTITYILTENAGALRLESNIMNYNLDEISTSTGWNAASQSIIYWILVFYQARFFIMYMKRFFTIGFLIVISPLITTTYAIDRAGDNKSQVFNTWGRELITNLIIQPLHAFLYLVFMFVAEEIAIVAPVFAIIFLMALSRGEKIVKTIFNLRGRATIHSMSETFKLKGK